jgi:hypothetical protein
MAVSSSIADRLPAGDNFILAHARRIVCDELLSRFDFTPKDLDRSSRIIDDALASLFHAGQHSPDALARYALHKALLTRFDFLRASRPA